MLALESRAAAPFPFCFRGFLPPPPSLPSPLLRRRARDTAPVAAMAARRAAAEGAGGRPCAKTSVEEEAEVEGTLRDDTAAAETDAVALKASEADRARAWRTMSGQSIIAPQMRETPAPPVEVPVTAKSPEALQPLPPLEAIALMLLLAAAASAAAVAESECGEGRGGCASGMRQGHREGAVGITPASSRAEGSEDDEEAADVDEDEEAPLPLLADADNVCPCCWFARCCSCIDAEVRGCASM